ncbi:hypothetical protein QQX98_005088 [Neonectria punicea]|uniref:Heterokaryon incompatibility domain-containing protein n=1 Tax=Neonectria punicea TaxID=979145 RepID=A0ABR1H6N2_9HYPO
MKDGFEHRFCTRTITRQDLRHYSGLGCPICSAFLGAIQDLAGDEACVRLFFNEGAEIFSDNLEYAPPAELDLQNFDWSQLSGALEEAELASLFSGSQVPSELFLPGAASTKPDVADKKAKPEIPVMTPSVRSDTVLSFVKNNLETCLRDHGRCEQPPSFLPRRVIDVGKAESDMIRLLEPSPETTGSYVALSYCWGNANSVTTTTSNIEQLKSGIKIDKLPKTLQDAVTFTRKLGIPFLWIDALCIIQDSVSDWEVESAKMGDIYTHAFLTVAATSAASADGGFLQQTERNALPQLQLKWPDGSVARAIVDPAGGSGMPSDGEPWNTRGWTFQEQMLATRLVIYSDGEVQWVCKSCRSCECGSVDQFAQDRNGTTIWHLTTPTEAHDLWVDLVSEYSARRLTVEVDRLPALSGIASRISRLTDSSYLGGLWSSDVLQGLCWFRSTPVEYCQPEFYRAPTFSWASVDGPTYCYHRDKEQDAKEPNIKPVCIDASTTVNGKNPFGVVTNGWIKIRAPLIPCTLRGCGVVLKGQTDIADNFNPDAELCDVFYRDSDGSLQTSAARRSFPQTEKSSADVALSLGEYPEEVLPASLLYIGCRTYDTPQDEPTRLLLILGRSSRHPQMHERLGLLVVSPVFPIPIPEDSFETVTII